MFLVIILITACQKEDNIAPELTLEGGDTVTTILNDDFEDPGFQAIDNIEGNISNRVVIDTDLNVDKVGYYEVSYTVIDNAGNQSPVKIRVIKVKNQAEKWSGVYDAKDETVYPGNDTIDFSVSLRIDSLLNYRVYLDRFYKDLQTDIFFDIYPDFEDLVIPYQEIAMDTASYYVQGNGTYTDTTFTMNYTINLPDGAELHQLNLLKQDE